MPGAWICDKCGLVLQKNNLYVKSGTIGADTKDEVEGCPNDGTAMRGLTWREVNNDYDKMLIEARTKFTAASEVIAKCEAALQAALKSLSEIADIDAENRAGLGHKAVDEALQHISKWKTP